MTREWTQERDGDFRTDVDSHRRYYWHPLGGLRCFEHGTMWRIRGLRDIATWEEIDAKIDEHERQVHP